MSGAGACLAHAPTPEVKDAAEYRAAIQPPPRRPVCPTVGAPSPTSSSNRSATPWTASRIRPPAERSLTTATPPGRPPRSCFRMSGTREPFTCDSFRATETPDCAVVWRRRAMKMLLPIVALTPVLFMACGGSTAAPTAAAGERYTGSYSYKNQQSGPDISGTLSFELGKSDFSEIRNIQIVVTGCPNANVQAESVLVPDQAGPPGRGAGWFTINLATTPKVGVWMNCGWHEGGRTSCGLALSIRSCGMFGGSDKDYGFPISKG